MVFYPPSFFPKIDHIPDDLNIPQFMKISARKTSLKPLVDYATGDCYNDLEEIFDTSNQISKALFHLFADIKISDEKIDIGCPGVGEFDHTVTILAENTIHNPAIVWAIHNIGAVVSPSSPANTVSEQVYQLKLSKAKMIFTTPYKLKTAVDAANQVGIPLSNIFLCTRGKKNKDIPSLEKFKNLDDLITLGKSLPEIPKVRFNKNEAKKRVAFLCFSSGTSGLPKGVKVSHYNVIANVLQINLITDVDPGPVLGLLPQFHIYGLVVLTHFTLFHGSSIILLAEFKYPTFLDAIQKYSIQILYVVPPILVGLLSDLKSPTPFASKFKLDSIQRIMTGAAPFSKELCQELMNTEFAKNIERKHGKPLSLCQGYGSTETSTVISTQHESAILYGASGSLIPGTSARLVDVSDEESKGKLREITSLNTPGELWVKSPSVTLGYVYSDNPDPTIDTLSKFLTSDGWFRTGDEAKFVPGAVPGDTQLVIVDRIKELIKTNGYQVAPAELEAFILTHPDVSEACVVPYPDDRAGEVPRAYVKLRPGIDNNKAVGTKIFNYVKKNKAKYKWLKGGVIIIDEIPKMASGKLLRRVLREKARKDFENSKKSKL